MIMKLLLCVVLMFVIGELSVAMIQGYRAYSRKIESIQLLEVITSEE